MKPEIVMVLALWLSTRQVQCRAPYLEGVPSKLLEEPLKSRGARRRRGKTTGLPKKREFLPNNKLNLRVIHWNAEGVANKTTELSHFLHQNNIQICCIQETHLQEDKPFKIRGYQCFRNVRKGRTKGGVLTLVRNNLHAEEVDRRTGESEFLHMKITSG